MEIFWSDEDQKFYTIPDGDVATHKEIKEYFMQNRNLIERIQEKN